MQHIQDKDFFWQWLNNPKEIGAIFPSSGLLAQAMAFQVKNINKGSIIELGAGTGVITSALLETGVAPEQLQVIEKNPALSHALRMKFPDIDVIDDDVLMHLRDMRKKNKPGEVHGIVSGLPMLLFDVKKQYILLRHAFSLLRQGGAFIQFTYGPTPPIAKSVMDRIGLKSTRVAFVWRNTPPAFVWRLERAFKKPDPQFKNVIDFHPAAKICQETKQASR